ncbi:MAG TPA: hypothetical protein VLX58_19090 [Bryobacteraceae bacterium]|nr:hypothetical protein [Bryobacteraceae bacterium]
MKHLEQEELILEYYGEQRDHQVHEHLESCQACRASFESLARVLNLMNEFHAPEPSADYGSRVWQRIAPELDRSPAAWWSGLAHWFEPRRLMAVGAMAALLLAAFLAGRVSQRRQQMAGLPAPVRERIMMVAVGEHLERSQMILVELVNNESKGPVDISSEQRRAEDLVSENRLYRQAALKSGDKAISSVLDELERVLLDIAHSPSKLDSAELEQVRQRIEANGILFKIRVVGSNLKEREKPPVSDPGAKSL